MTDSTSVDPTTTDSQDEDVVDVVAPEDLSYDAYVAAHSPLHQDDVVESLEDQDSGSVDVSEREDGEAPDVIPAIEDEVPVIIEWGVVGLQNSEGDAVSRNALRKNPPMLILYAGDTPFASVDLTPQVTARLMASLKQVKNAYTGETDAPPKTFSDRVHGVIDWGMKHKVRGFLALVILLSMTYSVLAGAGILTF